jgi:20S proteasome alpha/beta subunit
MTTVVYRDGVLAGDTRVTDPDIVPGSHRKVFQSRHGWLYGASGKVASFVKFYKWAESHSTRLLKKDPPDGDYSGILVSPKGVAYFVEDGSVWRVPDDTDFIAIGSGRTGALGALYMGATALQAVEMALKVDTNSGGPIDSVSLT